MPQIEHIEVASGTVPAIGYASSAVASTFADHSDRQRIYVVAKNGSTTVRHVLHYSLNTLLDLTRAMTLGANVAFDAGTGSVARYAYDDQSASGGGAMAKNFMAAAGYKIPPTSNKP